MLTAASLAAVASLQLKQRLMVRTLDGTKNNETRIKAQPRSHAMQYFLDYPVTTVHKRWKRDSDHPKRLTKQNYTLNMDAKGKKAKTTRKCYYHTQITFLSNAKT